MTKLDVTVKESRAIINLMDSFFRRHGIIKVWIAEKLGMPKATLNYALEVRGLTKDEAQRLTILLNETGHRLKKFHFTKDNSADLKRLREEFGIKQNWLAAQLQVSEEQFPSFAKRDHGFRPQERATLEAALHDTAIVLSTFQLEPYIQKAA